MNRVCLIGRLTDDPAIKYGKKDSVRASGVIAVDGYKDNVDFIPYTAFSFCAEFMEKYMVKGQRIGIEGRISVQNYTDRDGNDRVYTCVIAEHVYFADSKKEDANAENKSNRGNNRRNR